MKYFVLLLLIYPLFAKAIDTKNQNKIRLGVNLTEANESFWQQEKRRQEQTMPTQNWMIPERAFVTPKPLKLVFRIERQRNGIVQTILVRQNYIGFSVRY